MDFLSEYPEFTPDIDRIRCPLCGECGNVSGKGYTFSSGVTTCYDIQSSFPCTMHRYRCVGCPEAVKVGKKESDFTAMDIADQFDPILRERLPVVVGDAMMTTSLLDMIISLALNGNSLAMIYRHVSEMYHSYDTRNHLSYLRHAEYHYGRTAAGLLERSGGFQPEAYAGVRGGGTCKPPSMAFLCRAIVEDRRRRGGRRAEVAPTCGSRTVMDTNMNSIISAAMVTMKWKVTQMTRALFMRSQALSPTTAK